MLFIVSLKIYDFIVFRNYENLQMEGTSVISGSDASVCSDLRRSSSGEHF